MSPNPAASVEDQLTARCLVKKESTIDVLESDLQASHLVLQRLFWPLATAILLGRERLPFSSFRPPYLLQLPLSLLAYSCFSGGDRVNVTDILFPQMLHDTLKPTEFAHQLQSRLGSDTLDRLKIVAAKQDAQVDKLRHLHLQTLERKLQVDFTYWFLFRL